MAQSPPYALTLADLNRLLGSAAMPLSAPSGGGLYLASGVLTYAPPPFPASAKGSFFIGVNLSGMENPIPTAPTLAQMQYYASIGITTFRLPTLWEDWQSSLGAALTSAYVSQVQAIFANAVSVGAKILLDVHNYGHYNNIAVGQTGGPTIANYVQLWTLLVQQFSSSAAWYGADLMNEWSNMPDPTVPFAAQQAVITALRASPVSYTGPILYENNDYSGAWDWTSTAAKIAMESLVDPLNNLFPSPHGYFDNDASGGSEANGGWSYADEVAKGSVSGTGTAGFATGPQVGVQRGSVVVNWAKTYGLNHPIFGEGVWGRDDPGWNVLGLNFLEFAQANNCGIFLWGGSGFPASYPGCLDATTLGKQARQITLVRKFTAPNLAQPLPYYFSGGYVEGRTTGSKMAMTPRSRSKLRRVWRRPSTLIIAVRC